MRMNLSVVLGLILSALMVTAKRDKDRIASERIIQADEAAAELKEGYKAIVQAAAAIVQAASSSSKLANGWFKYQIIHERKTWTEAKDDCEARGAKLAMLRSDPEGAEVGKLRELKDSEEYWIGGFLGYENYITKCPQYYGHMGMTLERDKDGYINGGHRTQKNRLNFICQENLGDDEISDGQLNECTHSARLDLQLIIDSSPSIGSSNFERMMMGIADGLISQFEIGEDSTRVALSIFNENTYNIFGLEKYTDASSLKEAIKTVKYNAGGTWTAKAMQEALISYKEKMRKDSKIARACVVFTDGNANDDKFLQEASKAWADQDVAVFTVGIGNMISEFGLEKIAGSKSNERIMTNFKIIGGKAKSLLARVCKVISNRGLRIDDGNC